jgi:hypothetical protein
MDRGYDEGVSPITTSLARAGALLLAAAAACALPQPDGRDPAKKKSDRVASGTWGGTGIGLEVTDSGGTLEFDCAHGSIDEPLLLDAGGRFDAKGRFAREHGGPVREGEKENSQPIRCTGSVSGDEMTLVLTPEGGDTPIGTYALVHGRHPRIRKCL